MPGGGQVSALELPDARFVRIEDAGGARLGLRCGGHYQARIARWSHTGGAPWVQDDPPVVGSQRYIGNRSLEW
jgi:hypothetical protein